MSKPYIRRLRDSQSSAFMAERPISRRTALGLLGASAVYEQATAWHTRHPTMNTA
jgi:hypothetical protein